MFDVRCGLTRGRSDGRAYPHFVTRRHFFLLSTASEANGEI